MVCSSPFFTISGISTEALGSTGREDNLFPMSNCSKMAMVSSLTSIVAAVSTQKQSGGQGGKKANGQTM